MIYAPGCTLDQFTQDYTEKKVGERVKGFFPYEAITTDNNKEILSKIDLFEQKDFYSSLTKSIISDSNYQVYLKDYEQYAQRSDYLLHYNEQDTIIMAYQLTVTLFLIKCFIDISISFFIFPNLTFFTKLVLDIS
jgi:hypothetical protein